MSVSGQLHYMSRNPQRSYSDSKTASFKAIAFAPFQAVFTVVLGETSGSSHFSYWL